MIKECAEKYDTNHGMKLKYGSFEDANFKTGQILNFCLDFNQNIFTIEDNDKTFCYYSDKIDKEGKYYFFAGLYQFNHKISFID